MMLVLFVVVVGVAVVVGMLVTHSIPEVNEHDDSTDYRPTILGVCIGMLVGVMGLGSISIAYYDGIDSGYDDGYKIGYKIGERDTKIRMEEAE